MSAYRKKVTLEFVGVRLQIKNRAVLKGVSGVAEPGQLLAVMGPSGAGKTLLMNCLAGRQTGDVEGAILLNGQPISKRLRRQISFVLQEDLFLNELTLRDTLQFTADLRLPGSIPKADKARIVDNIIDTLDLRKCLDTKFGDTLHRGLSGGEKKRANIACELLTDPAVLLLDEPTSGLDSHSACELLDMLKKYAILSEKTVITTIHQPSSRVFHLFDRLLLLSEGQAVYFGDALQVVDYFAGLGLHCPRHYNPADFILDKVKGTEDERARLRRAGTTRSYNEVHYQSRPSISEVSGLADYHRRHSITGAYMESVELGGGSINQGLSLGSIADQTLSDSVFINCISDDRDDLTPAVDVDVDVDPENLTGPPAVTVPPHSSNTNSNATADYFLRTRRNALVKTYFTDTAGGVGDIAGSVVNGARIVSSASAVADDSLDSGEKWPTGFWRQLVTLTHRNFKQNKGIILSKLYVFKQISMALIIGALWFQVPLDEGHVRDLSGMLFFFAAYWGFESIFSVLTSFPSERDVIFKERSAGAYRLSTYFLSKIIGVFPLQIVLSLTSASIAFLMVGLHQSVFAYLCFAGTTVLYSQAGQAIGLFISAASSSPHQAIVLANVFMLTSMLLPGFYVETLPAAIRWFRHVSFTSYAYGAFLLDIFVVVPQSVSCNTTMTSPYGDCISTHDTNLSTVMDNNTLSSTTLNSTASTVGVIDGASVVENLVSLVLPIWAYHAVLVGYIVVFNFLAYIALRFGWKPS